MSDKQVISGLLSLVLMILLLPLQWLCCVAVTVLLHELGHYCAVRLLGGNIHNLRFGAGGAIMEADGLTRCSELICLLAGPIAGLLPAFFFHSFPTLAVCGIIQSVYNLLPIYPLDGGRIARNIINKISGTDHCFIVLEYSVILVLFLACIYVKVHFNISLFLFFGILLFRKTPCKPQKD